MSHKSWRLSIRSVVVIIVIIIFAVATSLLVHIQMAPTVILITILVIFVSFLCFSRPLLVSKDGSSCRCCCCCIILPFLVMNVLTFPVHVVVVVVRVAHHCDIVAVQEALHGWWSFCCKKLVKQATKQRRRGVCVLCLL